jgi:hypothetical protein
MAPKKSKPGGKKPTAPRWATQPFRELIDHTERLGQLLHLSMRGISMIRAVPKVIEALAQAEGHDGGEGRQRVQDAEREAELARREVSEGFPLLHAHTAIALWSALEAAVRLFMARWLQHHKPAMEVEVVQKLRVRICEYERLDGEDRFFYILDRLEQELSAPLKNGITKFESLLEPFGLAGPVDEDVRRDLFELSQVRNALVHRSGVADRRLVEACPWLQLKAGDQIHVRHEATQRYFASVMKYSIALIVRMGEHFGVDMSKFRSKAQAAEPSPAKIAKQITAGGADPRHPAHPVCGSRRVSR